MTVLSSEVLRVSVRFSDTQGNDHVNVFHFRALNTITDPDSTVLAAIAAWADATYSYMATNISNLVNEVDIKVDVVDFVGGVLTVVRNLGLTGWSMSTAPSAASDPMPPGVAALCKLLTGLGKVYGRKFIGMITENSGANGIISTSFQAQIANFAANFIAGITGVLTGGDLQAGVMSQKYTAFIPVTSYDVSDTIAYQRRRRQGTGS